MHKQVTQGCVYRWVPDAQESRAGFVLFEPTTGSVRPSDVDGRVTGDLVMDARSGTLTGEAAGVDRTVFAKTAAAILKRFIATGEPPETAHTYFG